MSFCWRAVWISNHNLWLHYTDQKSPPHWTSLTSLPPTSQLQSLLVLLFLPFTHLPSLPSWGADGWLEVDDLGEVDCLEMDLEGGWDRRGKLVWEVWRMKPLPPVGSLLNSPPSGRNPLWHPLQQLQPYFSSRAPDPLPLSDKYGGVGLTFMLWLHSQQITINPHHLPKIISRPGPRPNHHHHLHPTTLYTRGSWQGWAWLS